MRKITEKKALFDISKKEFDKLVKEKEIIEKTREEPDLPYRKKKTDYYAIYYPDFSMPKDYKRNRNEE
ncbi:MAG: hypothetical protein U9O98_06955 [Asgard group archaeon]|nr:hypothetical protein [Asgard group archaeon]